MLAIKISDISLFMKKILSENETAFDAFLLSEAKILMGSTFIFDGHINNGFYSDEEIEELKMNEQQQGHIFDTDMVRWKQIKPHVFSVIKGKKVPLSFSIVFYLSNENIDKLINDIKLGETSVKPDRLMLRILYEGGTLTAVTGSSYTSFSLDHTIDHAWDEAVQKFFTSLEIGFEVQ